MARSAGTTKTTAEGTKTPDALAVLAADHASVEKLFQRFEKLSPDATARKQELVDKIVHQLSMHAAIEEEIFYPAIRETIPAAERDVLAALDAHQQAKEALADIERLRAGDEALDTEMLALIEDVRAHVEEEERELFPRLRSAVSQERLEELGRALRAAKKIAPTHPHPKAPSTPPANVVLGAVMGVADRAFDLLPRPARTVALMAVRVPIEAGRKMFSLLKR